MHKPATRKFHFVCTKKKKMISNKEISLKFQKKCKAPLST